MWTNSIFNIRCFSFMMMMCLYCACLLIYNIISQRHQKPFSKNKREEDENQHANLIKYLWWFFLSLICYTTSSLTDMLINLHVRKCWCSLIWIRSGFYFLRHLYSIYNDKSYSHWIKCVSLSKKNLPQLFIS